MNKRLLKVKEKLEKERLDAILVSSVPNITYLTGFSNFSKEEREAYLLITKANQYIITDGRYSEAVSIHLPHFELIERTTTYPLSKIFNDLKKKHHIKKLGIEEDDITIAEQKSLAKHYNNTYHYSVTSLRMVKEQSEITAIEKACQLGDKAFDYILKKIRWNVAEKELAFEIEFFIKKHGAETAFPPIVAFGKNSSIPHHQTTMNSKLTINNIVLIDFGVRLNNYCSDMTRTIFFGKPTSEQKQMYQTVLEAQRKAIDYLSSRCHSDEGQNLKILKQVQDDMQAKKVDAVARDYILSNGYPSIPHSLGHGIGLEVHEAPRLSPRSKDALKPGMVFSIEPGIYLPRRSPEQNRRGEGGSGEFGVRIEDLVVLEPKGPRLLTKSPKEIIEL